MVGQLFISKRHGEKKNSILIGWMISKVYFAWIDDMIFKE
jgi:hypothetical protein